MRKVTYTVYGVFEADTYAKALEIAGGRDFCIEVNLTDVEKERPKLSPMREAMMKQFGFVSPRFIDKVVLPD